eukprot:5089010-Prymnesium_polylepis.1
MANRWATSNSEYGRGVMLQASKKGEDYYGRLAAQSHADAKVAAELQGEAWRETTLRVADAKVAPSVAALPSARPSNLSRPGATEVQSESQRLQERLRTLGLREHPITGDGACMFRAVADQLWGKQERHAEVRQRAIETLRAQRDHFAPFVPDDESFEQYLRRLSQPGEWGDNLMLQALASAFGVDINLVTTFPDAKIVRVETAAGGGAAAQHPRQLWLGFYADVHYVSVSADERSA